MRARPSPGRRTSPASSKSRRSTPRIGGVALQQAARRSSTQLSDGGRVGLQAAARRAAPRRTRAPAARDHERVGRAGSDLPAAPGELRGLVPRPRSATSRRRHRGSGRRGRHQDASDRHRSRDERGVERGIAAIAWLDANACVDGQRGLRDGGQRAQGDRHRPAGADGVDEGRQLGGLSLVGVDGTAGAAVPASRSTARRSGSCRAAATLPSASTSNVSLGNFELPVRRVGDHAGRAVARSRA